jgi:uncharacterized HAD superfamily protein
MIKPVVIVDLDGTIADVRHRLHFVQGPGKKRWKRFFQAQENDVPVAPVLARVRELCQKHEIVIVTARPDICREGTERWLERHSIPYSRMFMRRDGDHRPDYEVKKEILDRIGRDRVRLVLEDRPLVCRMYREAGLNVIEIESDQASQTVNDIY